MDFTSIGRQFGLSEEQTRAAFEALAPVVTAGVSRSSAQGGGGLADILGGLMGGNLAKAQDASVFGSSEAVDQGNAVLGEIFGSKDVSRGVAQQVSASTGIGESILKKLLPVIAAMVMSQIAGKAANAGGGAGGGLGDILGSILGGGQAQQPPAQQGGGGLGDILGGMLGGGQQGQSGGGLGDILGSVLGGGQQAGGQARGGGLEDILGSILGGSGGNSTAGNDLLNSVEQALRRR